MLPARTALVHVGSISSWTAPGSEAIARLVERLLAAAGADQRRSEHPARPGRRPAGRLIGNTPPTSARGWTGCSATGRHRQGQQRGPGLVEPDSRRQLDDAARQSGRAAPRWSCTDGARPAVAPPRRGLVHLAPPRVEVADTVGAGDSLAAGLRGPARGRGQPSGPPWSGWPTTTCSRVDEAPRGRGQLHAGRRRPPTRADSKARPGQPPR